MTPIPNWERSACRQQRPLYILPVTFVPSISLIPCRDVKQSKYSYNCPKPRCGYLFKRLSDFLKLIQGQFFACGECYFVLAGLPGHQPPEIEMLISIDDDSLLATNIRRFSDGFGYVLSLKMPVNGCSRLTLEDILLTAFACVTRTYCSFKLLTKAGMKPVEN